MFPHCGLAIQSFSHILLVHERTPHLVPMAHLVGRVPADNTSVTFCHTMSAQVFAEVAPIGGSLDIVGGGGGGCP